MNKDKNVNILIDKKIIVNLMGNVNDGATMISSLCSNVYLHYISEEYSSLFHDYENPRNKYKATVLHEHFNTPWKVASSIAPILLL